jgi:hypothetical protein
MILSWLRLKLVVTSFKTEKASWKPEWWKSQSLLFLLRKNFQRKGNSQLPNPLMLMYLLQVLCTNLFPRQTISSPKPFCETLPYSKKRSLKVRRLFDFMFSIISSVLEKEKKTTLSKIPNELMEDLLKFHRICFLSVELKDRKHVLEELSKIVGISAKTIRVNFFVSRPPLTSI